MFKIAGTTFSSDLRKPCWITGKSLSPLSKKCLVLEKIHIYIYIYIILNRMKSLHSYNPENVSKLRKAVCCATQSRRLVQAQPSKKGFIKTTKSVTLSPFSTTIIEGSTKLRSHDMRLNVIAESSTSTHLPPNVQCAPPTALWNLVQIEWQ